MPQLGGNNFAFIDSQNLNKSVERRGWKLDYSRFFIYLKENYRVCQAFLFFGYIAKYENLYNYLKGCGYTLIFKPVLPYFQGTIKGNTDAELILHTMIQYENFKKAIIVSGDGDFYCLVDYLNKQDKLERLLIPNSRSYSGLLKEFAVDRVDFISNLRNQLENKKSPA